MTEQNSDQDAGILRVTKEFSFEMAHALWNHDGPCRNIHGHSYRLYVTVRGRTVQDTGNSKLGMVIDFSDLKDVVTKEVIDYFDHSVVINSQDERPVVAGLKNEFEKVHVVNYQPTCENLVLRMAERIAKVLPGDIELYSLRLRETATSSAAWHASDNQRT